MPQDGISISLSWRSFSGSLGTQRLTVRATSQRLTEGRNADLDPSCEPTGSSDVGADDHRPLLVSRAHALAGVRARGGEEGIHRAVLRRVSGGRGRGGPAPAHGRSSDGAEHRASGGKSGYESRLLKHARSLLLFSSPLFSREARQNRLQTDALRQKYQHERASLYVTFILFGFLLASRLEAS
jgi:hypothetical protein